MAAGIAWSQAGMEIREGEPALMNGVSAVFPLLGMRIVYWEWRLTGRLICIKIVQNQGKLLNCSSLCSGP